jgi:hypothetical protein
MCYSNQAWSQVNVGQSAAVLTLTINEFELCRRDNYGLDFTSASLAASGKICNVSNRYCGFYSYKIEQF